MLSNRDVEIIVEKNMGNLFSYCLAIVKSKYDADDIVGKVLFLLFTKKESLVDKNIKNWLYSSADNFIKEHFRKKQIQERRNVYIDDMDEYNLPYTADNEYVIEHIERMDEKMIEYIKHRLSSEHGELFEFRYVESMTVRQIAKKTGMPRSTAAYKCRELEKEISEISEEIYK